MKSKMKIKRERENINDSNDWPSKNLLKKHFNLINFRKN